MNEPRNPRNIRTDAASGGSRKINRNGAARPQSGRPSTAGQSGGYVYHAPSGGTQQRRPPQRSAQPPRSTQSARSAQTAQSGRAAQSARSSQSVRYAHPARPGAAAPARRRKKRSPLKTALLSLLALVMVLCLGIFGVYQWVMGSIRPDSGETALDDAIATPEEFKGDVVNILIGGVDKDDTRDYGKGSSSNDGMTDMILYMNFDVKNKKINMLQFPRDIFVGEEWNTANTGKINEVPIRNDGMASLAKLLNEQYKLPVDYYITINMQSLREVVDAFGGIEVYVPEYMEFKGSVLNPGLQVMDGNAVEFFVRNRKTYAQGDIKRLDMQRYFYQGLFKRIRTATPIDIAKLTPAMLNYITTDIPAKTLVSLGVSFLQVDSANIMMCKIPTYNAAELYNKGSILITDADKTLDLINSYFMTYGSPVTSLDIPTRPTTGSSTDPNVQYMGQLDSNASGTTSDSGAAA